MTIEEIDAFLAVVEYGTLSLAADKLFISQSTISQRLKRLESELGIKLFLRQQGQRSTALTSSGADLVPMAQQWSSLWRDMYSLNASSGRTMISVGSVDLVNSVTFTDLYKQMMKHHPGIELSINTHHSIEIHSLLESRAVDIGFVFSPVKYPDIISTPVYSESMALIAHPGRGYYDDMSSSLLDPGKEIYLRWSADYELWHHSHWSRNQHLINVNTGTTMGHYLDEPGNWGIAPLSLVHFLEKRHGIASYQLKEAPPPLICYQLTHRYPKPSKSEALKLFQQEMEAFLSANHMISVYEP